MIFVLIITFIYRCVAQSFYVWADVESEPWKACKLQAQSGSSLDLVAMKLF